MRGEGGGARPRRAANGVNIDGGESTGTRKN